MSIGTQYISINAETAKILLTEGEAWVPVGTGLHLHLVLHGKVLRRRNWADALAQVSIIPDSGDPIPKGFYRVGGIIDGEMSAVWIAGSYEETYNPTFGPVEYVNRLHFDHIERLWAIHGTPRGRK